MSMLSAVYQCSYSHGTYRYITRIDDTYTYIALYAPVRTLLCMFIHLCVFVYYDIYTMYVWTHQVFNRECCKQGCYAHTTLCVHCVLGSS